MDTSRRPPVAARPYAWPWTGRLDPSRAALLVFTGDLGLPMPAPVATTISAVARELQSAGFTIVVLPAADTPVPGWLDADITVHRPRFGGFTGTSLDMTLRRAGLRDLVLAGSPFELGADCTMREANDLGYECMALEDCCSGLDADTFAGAISSIQMSGGIFGVVATSTELLAALAASNTSAVPATIGRS